MIYTSYFAVMKKIKEKCPNITFISIARHTPKWYVGIIDQRLAPSEELLADFKQGYITEDDYRVLFKEEQKNNKDHYEQLEKRYKNKVAVLLCYERPEKFCHRHLLNSKWKEYPL